MKLKLERKPPYRLQIVVGEVVVQEMLFDSLSLIHVLKGLLGFTPFCSDGQAGGVFDGRDADWVTWHSDDEQHGKGLLHFTVNEEGRIEDEDDRDDDDLDDDDDDEIVDLKEAVRRDPTDSAAKCRLAEHYVDRADMLVRTRHARQALAMYQAVLELDPGNGDGGFGPEFFGWRGTAHLLNGQVKEALEDFLLAIRRTGNLEAGMTCPSTDEERELLDEAKDRMGAGDRHWHSKQYRQAFEEYLAAIDLEPGLTKGIVEKLESTLRTLNKAQA